MPFRIKDHFENDLYYVLKVTGLYDQMDELADIYATELLYETEKALKHHH